MTCGTKLQVVCANCGTELPAAAAFCSTCGHKVGEPVPQQAPEEPAAASAPQAPAASDDGLRRFIPQELLSKLEFAAKHGGMVGERRRVTILFCDVEGSTAAAENLDPEEWADIMNGAFDRLIAPVYRYEGMLARLMGDAVLAFFGAPIAHEDDPERAVLAGLEILEDMESYKASVKRDWGIDLSVRIGINTGLVVVGAVGSDLRVEYTAMGDAVNVAARMEQTAAPDTVQISEETARLVERLFELEDLGSIEVKGRSEPVTSYRVTAAAARPDSIRGIAGLASPLVGRDAELEELSVLMRNLAGGQGRIVSVMGEAGLGKSRLVSELQAELAGPDGIADLSWHVGRSLSYETSTPYAPIKSLLRRITGLRGDEASAEAWRRIETLAVEATGGGAGSVAPYVAWMMGIELPEEHQGRVAYLEPPLLRAEVFRATIELLEGIGDAGPTVVVFEDLHWADSASIDLVTALLAVAERTSLGLILVFRPRRDEPSWTVHERAARDYPHLYTTVDVTPLDDTSTRELVAGLLAIDGLPESLRATILEKAEGNPFFVEELIRSLIDERLVVKDQDQWVAAGHVANVTIPDTVTALLTTRLDRLPERSRQVVQAASVIGRRFRYDEVAACLDDVEGLDEGLVDLQRRELIIEEARIPKRLYRFRHALVQDASYDTLLLKQRSRYHAAIGDFLERYQPERVEDLADHFLAAKQEQRALPYLVTAGEKAAHAYAIPVAIERLERAAALLEDTTEVGLVRRTWEALGKAKEFVFDIEGAMEAYRRLQEEGESRGDNAMYVSGLNKDALVRGFFMEDRESALGDLAKAEEMARENDLGAVLIESCVNQCYLRTGWAEFDQVEYYMNEVTRLGESLNAEEEMLFGMTHLANTLCYTTRFDEALEQAEKALAKAEQLGNLRYQAENLTFTIPICLLRNGDVAGASAAVERGLEIAQRIGDRSAEAFASTIQGRIAMAQGYMEEALSLFRRTMEAADATGVPYVIALGLCQAGTCYYNIGGPMLDVALEYHAKTAEVMEQPTGIILGAWLWSEIGHCALEAGAVDAAKDLFDRAVTEPTGPMYLMRPSALSGQIKVALVQDRLDDARRILGELEEYVETRQMRDFMPLARFTAGQVAAAAGDHEAALEALAECEQLCIDNGLRRLLVDVHAAQVRSLSALGRSEAEAVAERGRLVAASIAADLHDDELRSAFEAGSAALFAPVG